MRIAFTGASGTGKSTLANWASETYKLEFNPIGSRSVAKAMGFDNPYDVDAAGKRAEFQRRLLDDKVAWELEHESFVTDRTTFDNLLYTSLHDIKSVTNEQIDKATKAILQYDIIVFCPVSAFCNTAGDPHRVADLAYHRIYDAALHGLFLKLHRSSNPMRPHVVSLQTSDLERRKEILKEHIDVVFHPE